MAELRLTEETERRDIQDQIVEIETDEIIGRLNKNLENMITNGQMLKYQIIGQDTQNMNGMNETEKEDMIETDVINMMKITEGHTTERKEMNGSVQEHHQYSLQNALTHPTSKIIKILYQWKQTT